MYCRYSTPHRARRRHTCSRMERSTCWMSWGRTSETLKPPLQFSATGKLLSDPIYSGFNFGPNGKWGSITVTVLPDSSALALDWAWIRGQAIPTSPLSHIGLDGNADLLFGANGIVETLPAG